MATQRIPALQFQSQLSPKILVTTYGERYSQTHSWLARHVAQDLLLMYGKDAIVSQHDEETIRHWEEKDRQAEA